MTTQILSGYRYAQIQVGDTLQEIAARELGDASQWATLVWINDLSYPYITGDQELVSASVLAYGSQLIVPAPTVQVSAATDPLRVFGVDLQLSGGKLVAANGDFALVGGRANLKQAYLNRLNTPLGDLLFHPAYGNGAQALKGTVDGPTAGLLAATYVQSAILQDPRTASVSSSVAQVSGDTITVTATAVPVSGTSIDLTAAV
jgi:hypothetical protein